MSKELRLNQSDDWKADAILNDPKGYFAYARYASREEVKEEMAKEAYDRQERAMQRLKDFARAAFQGVLAGLGLGPHRVRTPEQRLDEALVKVEEK